MNSNKTKLLGIIGTLKINVLRMKISIYKITLFQCKSKGPPTACAMQFKNLVDSSSSVQSPVSNIWPRLQNCLNISNSFILGKKLCDLKHFFQVFVEQKFIHVDAAHSTCKWTDFWNFSRGFRWFISVLSFLSVN